MSIQEKSARNGLKPRWQQKVLIASMLLVLIAAPLLFYCYVLLTVADLAPVAVRLVIVGLLYFGLVGAICLMICRSLIFPIVKLGRVLDGAVKNEMDFQVEDMKHSHLLSEVFSNLQVVIDRISTLVLTESNTNLMKKQAELEALQSQINSHFLYNTLDTIRDQSHFAGLHDVESMSLALSKLFRYSISHYNDLVSFEEELDAIENYLLIQSLRFGDKFAKEYRIDSDTLQHKVPKMLIQPLIENAVIHGLEPKLGQGTLVISAYRTESRLVVHISDDGIGIAQDRLLEINDMLHKGEQVVIKKRSGSSIGLYNVNSRIQLLFGPEYQLTVFSAEQQFTDVQVTIPLV